MTSLDLISHCLLLVIVSLAAWWDLRTRLIPNFLTYPAFWVLMALHPTTLLSGLCAALVAALPFGLFAARGGVGFGDVKLAAVVGVGLGNLDAAVYWLLVATLFGLLHALLAVVRAKRWRGLTIPYAPAMAGAAYAVVAMAMWRAK